MEGYVRPHFAFGARVVNSRCANMTRGFAFGLQETAQPLIAPNSLLRETYQYHAQVPPGSLINTPERNS